MFTNSNNGFLAEISGHIMVNASFIMHTLVGGKKTPHSMHMADFATRLTVVYGS